MADKGSDFGSSLREAGSRASENLDFPRTSYVKEALKWQYNWIGLAGAVAFAAVSGSGLPLLLAAGLELMYLSLVPQSSAFRRLVRSWRYAEQKRQREMTLSQMLDELPNELRARYQDLCGICRVIRINYNRLSSTSQMFVSQMDDKLRGLLHAYLRLLHSSHQHREYLRSTDPEIIKREIDQLKRTLEKDAPRVREINYKRVDILARRLQKFEKIRENRQVIDAQCAAIEDVLKLIRDQSVTLRDPQQVSVQLESLVQEVEQTEETVREVEAIFSLAAPEAEGLLGGMGISATGSAQGQESSGETRSRLRT